VRSKKAFLALLPAMALVAGCGANTAIEKSYIMTGLFTEVDEAIAKAGNLKIGETVCPSGLKTAGFDPDAQNVKIFAGATGAQYFLGTANPQVAVTSPEDVKKISQEFSLYATYVYPIRNPKKDKDMVYFNKQKSLTTGTDGDFVIVCRENKVYSHGWTGKKKINEPGEYKQTGGNVLPWFLNILGNPLSLIGL